MFNSCPTPVSRTLIGTHSYTFRFETIQSAACMAVVLVVYPGTSLRQVVLYVLGMSLSSLGWSIQISGMQKTAAGDLTCETDFLYMYITFEIILNLNTKNGHTETKPCPHLNTNIHTCIYLIYRPFLFPIVISSTFLGLTSIMQGALLLSRFARCLLWNLHRSQ